MRRESTTDVEAAQCCLVEAPTYAQERKQRRGVESHPTIDPMHRSPSDQFIGNHAQQHASKLLFVLLDQKQRAEIRPR
ncbi:MAG: hypothetical protein CXT64_00075 [Methanobacteriota archaeon]|jgi:hypothetical protein|nr:MAG: hypothetical protein CXT64_00075 [Euryarchaeota archaeon]